MRKLRLQTKLLFLVLLLATVPSAIFAQGTRVVKGKVLSSTDGKPLPGASIFIDQTIGAESDQKGVITNYGLGTVSDVNGNFSITIPKNVKVLTCSFISFETQKVSVDGKDFIEIKLAEANTAIDEVVVTGYQNIKQRKNTSSVAKIEAKDFKQAGVASVDQMLMGQVAGVQISNVSGAPGAPSKIRIRGTASLEGNQDPLWVLDGMPLEGTMPNLKEQNIGDLFNSSIAGLNPNDIADITILKDAAATAIYGTRAANGVIVITTKKGKRGKLDINLNTNLSVTMRPDFDKLNLLNTDQKVNWELDLAKRADLTYRSNVGSVAQILEKTGELAAYQQNGFSGLSATTQQMINDLRKVNTDWGKEIYRQAVNQDYSLSISGGNEKANYYFSAGYFDEKGSTKGTGLNRFNLTLKTDYNLTEKFNVGVSIYTSQKEQNSYLSGIGNSATPSRYARIANPYLGIYDSKGNYVYDPNINPVNDNIIPFNIIEDRENTSNTMKAQSLNTIFDARWEILKDIRLTSQFGMQYDLANTEKIGLENSYQARYYKNASYYSDPNTGETLHYIKKGGVIETLNERSNQWNWKNMLEMNKQLGDLHEVDFMLGNELRRTYNNRLKTLGLEYNPQTLETNPSIFPSTYEIGPTSIFNPHSKTKVENAFVSFFSTLSYTYNRRYTLFGSIRYDGSDLYGVDPKYKYLPLWSAGGTWNVTQEEFMKNTPWITTLKARLSYGLQGNIDKSTSPFVIGKYGTTTILPGNRVTYLNVENAPNEFLRWEKTATWNGGLDLGFLRNRILVGIDLYHRVSSDLIGLRSLPLETGFDYSNQNWAQVTNKGFEISLTTKNIQKSNFSWTTNFNISKNINNVDKFQIKVNDITPSIQGHPVNGVFGYKTAGLDDQGYPLLWKDGKKVSIMDAFQLYDIGGWSYPSLSEKEQRDMYSYLGDKDPKLSGGITNNFSYKGLSLYISMNFNIKQLIQETPFYSMSEYDRGINTSTKIYDIWSENNKNGKYPAIIEANSYGGSRAVEANYMSTIFSKLDIWYKEVSYLRVSNIRLSYDLPASIVKKIRVEKVRFNLECRNPFVFGTNYNGFFDPETYGNIYSQPIPRSISFGVNVNF